MKEVERMNTAMVNPNQWAGFMSRHDPYTGKEIAIAVGNLDIWQEIAEIGKL